MNDNLLKITMITMMTIMTIMTVRFPGKEPVTIKRKLGATYSVQMILSLCEFCRICK